MNLDIEAINNATFLSERIVNAIVAANRPLSLREFRRVVSWNYEQLRNQVRVMNNRRKLQTFDVDGDIYYGLPAMSMPEEFEDINIAA